MSAYITDQCMKFKVAVCGGGGMLKHSHSLFLTQSIRCWKKRTNHSLRPATVCGNLGFVCSTKARVYRTCFHHYRSNNRRLLQQATENQQQTSANGYTGYSWPGRISCFERFVSYCERLCHSTSHSVVLT